MVNVCQGNELRLLSPISFANLVVMLCDLCLHVWMIISIVRKLINVSCKTVFATEFVGLYEFGYDDVCCSLVTLTIERFRAAVSISKRYVTSEKMRLAISSASLCLLRTFLL